MGSPKCSDVDNTACSTGDRRGHPLVSGEPCLKRQTLLNDVPSMPMPRNLDYTFQKEGYCNLYSSYMWFGDQLVYCP